MILDYTVTWLEMTGRSDLPRRPAPDGLSLVRAHDPPVHFFRYLYDAVGSPYEWTDLHEWSDAAVADYVRHEAMHLHVAYAAGCPAGFVLLDHREAPTTDVAYFGLVPEVTGRGIGTWLLLEGVHTAWDAGIGRLTVNTCTLDHPGALPLYRKVGFVPVREEARQRTAST